MIEIRLGAARTLLLPVLPVMLVLLSVLASTTASAQTPGGGGAPLPGPSASNAEAADRAQKESERTLYWIRVLADKPASKAAAVASPPTAATAAARPPARVRSLEPARIAAGPAPARAPSGASGAASSRDMTAALNKPGAIDLPPTAAGPATSSRVPGTDAMAAVPPVGAAPFATTALVAPGLLPLAGPPASVAPSGALADDTPDTGLVLAESVDPRFPPTLMTRLRKGHVEVRFDVAADGHVESASVEHASNHGLEPAALDAVRQWRFKPGKRGHAAVVDLAFDMDS